jgi:hypothetical protein
MSTDWRLFCKDCLDTEKLYCSYSPVHLEEVREILKYASVFARSDRGPRIPWDWFARHQGHTLRPISEYGEVDGACAQMRGVRPRRVACVRS